MKIYRKILFSREGHWKRALILYKMHANILYGKFLKRRRFFSFELSRERSTEIWWHVKIYRKTLFSREDYWERALILYKKHANILYGKFLKRRRFFSFELSRDDRQKFGDMWKFIEKFSSREKVIENAL